MDADEARSKARITKRESRVNDEVRMTDRVPRGAAHFRHFS
jgi:hypothetical protein